MPNSRLARSKTLPRRFTTLLCLLIALIVLRAEAVDLRGALLFTGWENERSSIIYRMDADGSDLRALTKEGDRNHSPELSRDGSSIVFVSRRDGSANIYRMDPDGGNVRPLVVDENHNAHPTWSPDGSRVAYFKLGHGVDGLYAVDVEDRSKELIAKGNWAVWTVSTTIRWSPDGSMLTAIKNSWDTWVMDADGSNPRDVSPDFIGWWPTWSPDSARLASILSAWQVFPRRQFSDLFLVDVSNGNTERVALNLGSDFSAWSPFGDAIAYVTSVDGGSVIAVFDLATGEHRTIREFNFQVEGLYWADPRALTVSPQAKLPTTWGGIKAP